MTSRKGKGRKRSGLRLRSQRNRVDVNLRGEERKDALEAGRNARVDDVNVARQPLGAPVNHGEVGAWSR